MTGRLVALLLVLPLLGCGPSEERDAAGSSSAPSPSHSESPSDPESPTPSSASAPNDIVAVAISDPRKPSDFKGSDDEFLQRAHSYLERADVRIGVSDPALVDMGREFCSILSGGGMLADKVDFWAGLIRLPEGHDIPIFSAASDVFCGDLLEGYLRIRRGAQSQEPTPRQRADLVRFAATLHQPGGLPQVEAMSSQELQDAARMLCTAPSRSKLLDTSERLSRLVPPRALVKFLLALGLGYCPEESKHLATALGLRAAA